MMSCAIIGIIVLIWGVSGVATVRLNRIMFPEPVVRGVDEMLLVITLLTGPMGYAIMRLVQHDIKSW
jgi:hypothetical protein